MPNAQFLSEQREADSAILSCIGRTTCNPTSTSAENCALELNIGQILGLMRSSGY